LPWIKSARSVVISLGIDTQEYGSIPRSGHFRSRLDLPETSPLLTFLGRISPLKGLPHLFRSMRLVSAEMRGAILVLAGPDDRGHTRELKRLANEIGVEDLVRWVGTVSGAEKVDLLLDSDLLVLPSVSDSFGLAAVEAMAVGCPVVLSSEVGIAPLVRMYDAGWVTPGKPKALARTILEVLQDTATREAKILAARRLVEERFDADKVAPEMLTFYRQCIDTSTLK